MASKRLKGKGDGRRSRPARLNRRDVLRGAALAAAGLAVPAVWTAKMVAAVLPGGTLNPLTVPKYVQPLVIPPAMPATAGGTVDYYEIAVQQFQQQILPAPLPRTTVWSYGTAGMFHYPAFTIEATVGRPVRVKWINGLMDASGNYLPHLLSVDPTLHWANPPGGAAGRDTRPTFASTPGPYTGPVPLVTHVHGAHTLQESDGYPEAWYLPPAANIPGGYASTGTYYDLFGAGQGWTPGSATFDYPNNQRATTLWYHDHTLGMTRLNVYAGPAGFYLLRGGPDDQVAGVLPGPAPGRGPAPYYEIPIAIQDRSFNSDGSLFYPGSRQFFDGYAGPYIPGSDVAPIWNPEFFGNTMVVNGRAWPYLNVEQRRYRFRFLNGCNSRFLILAGDKGVTFWQIGAEGGFLPAPVKLKQLLMAPAERADVIIDFSTYPVGSKITLLNQGPDMPFGGNVTGQAKADPATTGQVMQFRVVKRVGADASTPPGQLGLPRLAPLGAAAAVRKVSLNEMMSMAFNGPAAAMLGTVGANGAGVLKMWDDPVTEQPAQGTVETWEIHNFTIDAHPIHLHQVQFQVVNRQAMGSKKARAPEAWEKGFKDTVIAYPGEITRINARFDLPGRFVWHCHIVEHEDNEMMRPLDVV